MLFPYQQCLEHFHEQVEKEHVPEIETQLETFAPGTPIIKAMNCNIDSEVVFVSSLGSKTKRNGDITPHAHEEFESEELFVEQGVDPDTIIELDQSHQALRAKGFVHTSQGLRLLQGVGSRIDLTEPSL